MNSVGKPDDLLPPEFSVTGGGFVTTGNQVLLARMVSNVAENAVRHNVAGGWVRAEVSPGSMVVENSGPVLDPAQVVTLGRPFRRLGFSRTGSGTGLGLAIASAVASAHGGSLTLAARPSGGLRVEIRLPVADPRTGVGAGPVTGAGSVGEPRS